MHNGPNCTAPTAPEPEGYGCHVQVAAQSQEVLPVVYVPGVLLTPPGVTAGGDVPGHPDLVYGYPNRSCVVKTPRFGMIYANTDDPRCCVLGYQCNSESIFCMKHVVNVGHPKGKCCVIVLMTVICTVVAASIVFRVILTSDGSEE